MHTYLKAKKLGQHFLTSPGAVEKMVSTSGVKKGDTVFEIGPGRGVLTHALLATGAHIIAIEKDESLIPLIQERFKKEIDSGQLELISGDILTYDLNLVPSPYKLVANIPYYITGEIIRMFLSAKHAPERMTLLVQKEVAERIVAKPARPNGRSGGDGKESILSLSVKFFGRPTYIQTVKKGSFNPAPKVDSAILKIDVGTKNEIRKTKNGGDGEEKFFEMIKTGFKSKRKKLISNLTSIYDKNALMSAFEKLHLSENTRAEDVVLETWLDLLHIIG